MAYMIGNEGSYPNLPDEYCGNCLLQDYASVGGYSNLRPGRPRPTEYKTSAELEADGVLGLYLVRAIALGDLIKIHPETREIATPPELMEPESR